MSPASRARKWFVHIGLAIVSSVAVVAQTNVTPQGTEYAITGPLKGEQLRPSVAFGNAGGFVVWDDNATDPSGQGVSGFRLDASGVPSGGIIRVNQSMGNDQQNACIRMLNGGGAAVVWESGKPGAQNVFVRFLTPSGDFATDELLVNRAAYQGVNRYTTNWTLIRNNKVRTRKQTIRENIKNRQEFNALPVLAVLADGSVVVAYGSSRKESIKTVGLSEQIVWNDKKSIFITNRTRVPLHLQFNYMQDVYAQRLSAAGEKLGGEFVLNSNRDFNQRHPGLAALASGGFVTCWINEVPGGSARVNTSNQIVRAGGRVDVYARLFNHEGTPVGPEFRINTANSICDAPTVTARADGGFTVAWAERDLIQAHGLELWFRSFDQFGTALGTPIRANAHQVGDQFAPTLASVGGRELLVWSSMGQDGSWEGVYARLLHGHSIAGDEFRVNTRAYLRQIQPAVSANGSSAMVVWSSYAFSSGHDLFAQRFQVP